MQVICLQFVSKENAEKRDNVVRKKQEINLEKIFSVKEEVNEMFTSV